MTREQIISLVLAKIDEVSPLAQEQEFSPAGIVDAVMNESTVTMLKKAPLHLMTPVKVNTGGANFVHQINDDGTGHIALPVNFARLYSFKMQAWSRPIEKAISTENPLYKLQHNAVTRGKSIKPVVALNYYNDGAGVDDPNTGIDPPVEGWNALPPIYITDETIYHGTAAGERHIPAGGELNQLLAYAGGSGIAGWTAMTDGIHGNRGGGSLHGLATEAEHGFMSSFDKAKLNTVEPYANYYTHPNQQGYKHIPQGGVAHDMLVWSALGTVVWIDPYTILEPKIEAGAENEFFSWDKTWRQIDYTMIANTPPSVDLSNYVTLDGAQSITGAKTFINANGIVVKNTNTTKLLKIAVTSGTSPYSGEIRYDVIGANRVWLLPDRSGTFAMTDQLYWSSATNGIRTLNNIGVNADPASTTGAVISAATIGLQATASNTTGVTFGVRGIVSSSNADSVGVVGIATTGVGIAGVSNNGRSVYGYNTGSGSAGYFENVGTGYGLRATAVDLLKAAKITGRLEIDGSGLSVGGGDAAVVITSGKHGLRLAVPNHAWGFFVDSEYNNSAISAKGGMAILDNPSTGVYPLFSFGGHGAIESWLIGRGGYDMYSTGHLVFGRNDDSTYVRPKLAIKPTGGIEAVSHISNSVQATIYPESTNTSVTVATFLRKTSALHPANGIAGLLAFSLPNYSGSIITPSYIEWKLTDVTTGSEQAEFSIYHNSAVRLTINKDNDIIIGSGTDIKFAANGDGILLKSPSGNYFRIVVSDAGVLSTVSV